MEYRAIVAGTGFEGRAARIRAYAKPGVELDLKREPENPYDPNAIAVYLRVRKWYTLFREVPMQIGYVKRNRAEMLSKRIDEGGRIVSAHIVSMHTGQKHPRVSINIKTDW